MTNKLSSLLVLALMLFALSGCLPAQVSVPDHWQEQPVDTMPPFDPATLGPDESFVQLLVSYGGTTSHNVLRVGPVTNSDTPEGILWDPAGRFGVDHKPWPRRGDVLMPSPSAARYWEFRLWLGNQNRGMSREMLVLEWIVPRESVEPMYEVLSQAWEGDGKSETFDSEVMGGFCGIAMANFVQKYGSDALPVNRSYINGHNMAHDLWRKLPPHRAFLFKRNGSTLQYFYEKPADTVTLSE